MSSDTTAVTVPPVARARMETPGRRIWRATYAQFEFKLGLFLLIVLVGTALIYPHLSSSSERHAAWHIKQRFMAAGLPARRPLDASARHRPARPRPLFLRALVGLQNALAIGVSARAHPDVRGRRGRRPAFRRLLRRHGSTRC
jgi:hypothetical protein